MVFYATGIGGTAMEELVHEGVIAGVMDLTTREIMAELVGSTFVSGLDRLEAPARKGIPHVIAPGGLHVVAFGGPRVVPARDRDRLFYDHTPVLTTMRATEEKTRSWHGPWPKKPTGADGPSA